MAEKSESKSPKSATPDKSEAKVDAKASTERSRAVDAAILTIEKQFGRGAIMKLGSRERLEVDTIPTGAISLDLALGVGGLPRGRISEIFGPESSGKTTICQHIIVDESALTGEVYPVAKMQLDPANATQFYNSNISF